MIETYLPAYLVITLLFSYAAAIYLKGRFPGENEARKQFDEERIKNLEETRVQKFLARASLYKYNRLTITLFIFLFNIAIPVVGYIFTLWICWYLIHREYEKKVILTNILDLNEFKETFLKTERIFGESSMINILNDAYIPKPKKLRALASLASQPTPASLSIIKQTLSSTDDEIRLYGYSILNNLEKKINSKINSNLKLIQEKSIQKEHEKNQKDIEIDEAIIATASEELAFSYWKLIYMELSHESLKNNFLDSALHHITIAKKFYHKKIEQESKILEKLKENQEDNIIKIRQKKVKIEEYYEKLSSLYALAGKIFLYRESYEEAQTELTVAKELLPEKSSATVPYLAEIYYNIGKYNVTHAILNQHSSLQFNTSLYPVIKVWEDEENA